MFDHIEVIEVTGLMPQHPRAPHLQQIASEGQVEAFTVFEFNMQKLDSAWQPCQVSSQ